MNSKSFILVILLTFCLYSRKIHAYAINNDNEPGDLTPRNVASRGLRNFFINGNGNCYSDEGDLKPQILNVEWLPNYQLKVTVQSPTTYYYGSRCTLAPSAIGHFTFKDIQSGRGYRFSKKAKWINGYNWDNTESDGACPDYTGVNPYEYTVIYDPKAEPSKGASIIVALAIYYSCYSSGNVAYCDSCDVKYQSTYQ